MLSTEFGGTIGKPVVESLCPRMYASAIYVQIKKRIMKCETLKFINKTRDNYEFAIDDKKGGSGFTINELFLTGRFVAHSCLRL